MKALSIRQPWAWAILHGGKRLENRDWAGCAYRGPILIHAAKSVGTRAEFHDAAEGVLEVLGDIGPMLEFEKLIVTDGRWKPGTLHRGGIVGRAEIVDVILDGGHSTSRVYPSGRAARRLHELGDSPWYTGGFALVLADVEPLPFVPWNGELGLFDVPEDYAAREVRRG